jgi:CheY-like chemotaxis protein
LEADAEANLGAAFSMASISDIHVLVVDDNRQMRFLVRCLLRAGGVVDVSEAASAQEAFELMRARQVDLVIVDWMTASPSPA